jgi:glyoxylase-like metal-dependent hydrolase (beta-lactamase superfamily II)
LAAPEIVCLTNGSFAENCYLIADPESAEAVVVDPGEEVEVFLNRAAHEEWDLREIWLTHAHLDHVAGVAEVVRRWGIPVALHPDDRELYDHVASQAQWLGVRVETPPPPDRALAAGALVTIGRCQFEVRHVPGHSPGSVAFVGHGVALVGDALFQGSVGRVDLPGGDGPTLLSSIRDELMSLPDETRVLPGHGPETTIGQERRTNPFLTGAFPLV